MRKTVVALALTFGSLISVPNVLAQGTATLKLKIVVEGDVPMSGVVPNVNDPMCAGVKYDRILVGKNGELENFVVMFDEEKSKLKLPDVVPGPAAESVLLDNSKCLFTPKVVVARPGQTVNVKNSDQTGHNANFKMLKNPQKNFLIPAGQAREYALDPNLVEPAPMPISCDVHPWMTAHIIVKPHPFVGVSNDKGEIEIKDLPVGAAATFRVWHESAGPISELKVGGKAEKLTRNRWDLDLKAGDNDLGVVKLDAKNLKAP